MVTLLGRRQDSAAKTFASKFLLGHSDTINDITGAPKLYTASD